MLHRVVRMKFSPETIRSFIEIFYKKQKFIQAFEGCESVELMNDESDNMVLYTLSKWESNDALQAYRNSDMFAVTWKQVKPLFSDKAQAFSLIKHIADET